MRSYQNMVESPEMGTRAFKGDACQERENVWEEPGKTGCTDDKIVQGTTGTWICLWEGYKGSGGSLGKERPQVPVHPSLDCPDLPKDRVKTRKT